LERLSEDRVVTVNALWGENPPERQFSGGRNRVVIASLKGPGIITMMHFALPQAMKLDRALILRIYWDGERRPSVESPLVDFFCDPNGALERVDSALVNKKRGWNCYFPMPFRRSARVELTWDGRGGGASWSSAPCYSYVTYRQVPKLPAGSAYFHAVWNQASLLLGKADYPVFSAVGRGQFVGWNMTIRSVAPAPEGYPVDENVKLTVDGEKQASTEWQGLEDGFGFSWGFPPEPNAFPYTGWQPFMDGAAAYRFCLSDRVDFRRSFRMAVGFGAREGPFFKRQYSQAGSPLQLSSVAYWYQTEPHAPFAPLPAYRQRLPGLGAKQAAEARERSKRYRQAGEAVVLNCGLPANEEEYLAPGWDYRLVRGYSYNDAAGTLWKGPVRSCWAGDRSLAFELLCPRGSSGLLRLFMVDGDRFQGGRRQRVFVNERQVADVSEFAEGKWVEAPVSSAEAASGRIRVRIANLRAGANVVVSQVRFVAGAH
jgi:hypothetical protein